MRLQTGTFRRFILVAFGLAACTSSDRQQHACSDSIGLEPIVELSFRGAPFLPTHGRALAANRDLTRFAFVADNAAAEVALFDSVGSLKAILGRDGEGPQEFRSISALAYSTGDTLWVFDADLRKANVYTPEGSYVRTVPLNVSPSRVFGRSGGDFVMTIRPGSTHRAAILDRDGTIEYLAPPPADAGRSDHYLPHPLASDGADRFWIIGFHSYRVDLWTREGAAIYSIERKPEWFTRPFPGEVLEQFDGMIDTNAAILSSAYDPDNDLLWLVGGAPAAHPDISTGTVGHDTRPDEAAEATRGLIDHVIEVLKGSTGELVACRWYDYLPLTLTGSVGYLVDSSDPSSSRVSVVRPVLVAP